MKTVQQISHPASQRTGQHDGQRSHLVLASVLFFLSGCTGLIYEIIWFKRFTHVWGGSSLALTVVVASFLGGLGLGAYLLGRHADRVARPLEWYGKIEIAIGLIAVVIPLEITLMFRVAAALPTALMELPLALAAVRLALTFVVIGPACLLMGATLPFLVKHFAPVLGSGSATAWVYAVNTLGAAVGCFAAGFYLLPSIGLSATNFLSVAVNLALGCGAIALARREAAAPSPPKIAETSAAPSNATWRPSTLLAAAAVTGFAALALQIIWTRQLALVLGGTTYAFTAVLFVVLVGIAIGSLAFRLKLERITDQAAVLGVTLLFLVGGAHFGKSLLEEITAGAANVIALRESSSWNAFICLTASSALQLIPSIAMGILFPWFVNAARFSAGSVGAGVGRIYAFNTVGTITGVVTATFLLLPSFGAGRATGVCLLLYFLVWIALFPSTGMRRQLLSGVVAAALLGLAVSAMRPEDPRITGVGQYMYGFAPPETLREQSRILHHVDGASCSVLVREMTGGFRALSVNGKTDASDGMDDMPMQLGLAYLPAFLHPRARQILIIGYGSGCTPGAGLLIPDAHVTCCEIEPAVYDGSRFFSHVNHRPNESPNLKMVFNDGRNHLQCTETRYDLLLSEPSNPWIAGVSNLFTREFYVEAKERLAEDGILAQWIQTYSIETEDYAAIAATVASVFPEYALLRVSPGDTILLASTRRLVPGADTIERAQDMVDSTPEILADLRTYFGTSDVRDLLLRTLLLDTRGVNRLVARWARPEDVITDLNLRLEFETPHSLFRRQSTGPGTTRAILAAIPDGWFTSRLKGWGCGATQVSALRELERAAAGVEDTAFMGRLAADVLAFDAGNSHFLVSHLVAGDAPSGTLRESLERVVSGPLDESTRLGVALCTATRYEEAVEVFRSLTRRFPNSATTWANLSVNLRATGREEEAAEALARASALDPLNDYVVELRQEQGLDEL